VWSGRNAVTKRMSNRTTSSIVGLAAVSVAIYLESHGKQLAAQCFLWSFLAFIAPVGVALITGGGFLRAWFWVSLLATASLHGLLLWSVWGKMPFPQSPVVLVYGFIEAIILAFVCAQIREWIPVDRGKTKC
jgi:hypothetical protein